MDLTFIFDFKEKKETITINGPFVISEQSLESMEYANIKIVPPEDKLTADQEWSITAPIFQTACDLLSVDLSSLQQEVIQILNMNTSLEDVAAILSGRSGHPLLNDLDLSRSFWEKHRYYEANFDTLISLRKYANFLSNGTISRDPAFFCSFFNSVAKAHFDTEHGTILTDADVNHVSINEMLTDDGSELMLKKILNTDFSLDKRTSVVTGHGSVVALCAFTIFYALKAGCAIKHCENCGKFFVAFNHNNTVYCDRKMADGTGRTCKTYGNSELWYDNLSKDECKRLHRSIYMRLQMCVKRADELDRPSHKEKFEKFKMESHKHKKRVKQRQETELEYLEWLRKQ